MSSPTASFETDLVATGEGRSNQTELWRRYAKSGHGSTLENNLIEQYIPLVKAVVGRLAMTLPAHVNSDELQSQQRHFLRNLRAGADPRRSLR